MIKVLGKTKVLANIFNYNINNYINNLHVPVGHTGLIYKAFRFSPIKIWNCVEANVSINSSYTSFKNVICLEIM